MTTFTLILVFVVLLAALVYFFGLRGLFRKIPEKLSEPPQEYLPGFELPNSEKRNIVGSNGKIVAKVIFYWGELQIYLDIHSIRKFELPINSLVKIWNKPDIYAAKVEEKPGCVVYLPHGLQLVEEQIINPKT